MYRLSVCIPVFNRQVGDLLTPLLRQAAKVSAAVEFVVFDDGSHEDTQQANQWLKNEPHVKYHEAGKNLGRAAIRNRLAEKADSDYLLFLDDDSKIFHDGFLQKYLEQQQEQTVVCGGREYTDQVPGKEFALHWHYGHKKESRSAAQRSAYPYEAFHSNNFMIPKGIWQQLPFDESLSQYGHEDTLLGYNLHKHEVRVVHIDNPVIHATLDANKEFLKKSRMAVENLKTLYDRGDWGFNSSVKLLRVYHRIRNLRLRGSFAALYHNRKKSWERQLLNAETPSLRIFNLYKLGYLCSLKGN